MAKTNREKKLWHIPKRGNVHQTVFMVHKLSESDFNNKSWSTQKQEKLAGEMGRVGLTASGKALTHQSIRTLLANIPQYLGFVGKKNQNDSDILFVTRAGEKLIEEFPIEKVVYFHNSGRGSSHSIKSYLDAGLDIKQSVVFKEQMSKLIITNPNLNSDCVGVLLFPFIFTLKVLKEVEYLDLQEIAYILFHSPNDDHLPSTIARIKNFRKLTKEFREYEINEYCKTEEGKLTLVDAPSANYFCLLCESTGVCKRSKVYVENLDKEISSLKIEDAESADLILEKYSNVDAFDFKDNISLWYEYFGNPRNMFPPFYLKLKINNISDSLISVSGPGGSVCSDILNERNRYSVVFPVFSDAEYIVDCYDSLTGEKILSEKIVSEKNKNEIELNLDVSVKKEIIKQDNSEKISELLTRNEYEFDNSYSKKLHLILEHFGENYFHNVYKGGRLEYLFFIILKKMQENGFVDELQWNGKVGKYGIALPAPGRASGEPDIVFKVNDKTYVLELTTIGSTTMQWSAEGSSVPDHIEKYKERNPKENVQGIFSAPAIYPRNKEHLTRSLEKGNTKITFIDCFSFSRYLESINSKEDLINYLETL